MRLGLIWHKLPVSMMVLHHIALLATGCNINRKQLQPAISINKMLHCCLTLALQLRLHPKHKGWLLCIQAVAETFGGSCQQSHLPVFVSFAYQ